MIGAQGDVDLEELERLAGYASLKAEANGQFELGLDAADLKRFMDANWQRAKGRRRLIDRKLMDGEWPVLLEVLGRNGRGGRYLAIADVRRLVIDRQLPERLLSRLPAR